MFCPNCGSQNEEGSMFCIECGARLDGQSGAPNAQAPTQSFYQGDNQQYQYYPNYSQYASQSKPKTGKIIGITIGIIVLFFVLLGAFLIFVMPKLIVDENYKPPVESHPEGYHEHTDYSDIDRSTLPYGDENIMKDFSYTDGWKNMSSSAKRMTDFESTLGFWKAVMITDPENESEEGTSYDYFNVEISGLPDDTFVIFNWNRRVIESTGEEMDLKASAGGLTGTFKNGSINAENGNMVELTDFWSDGNKEYAVGKFTWTNNSVGYIGLIREKGE